MPTRYMTFLLVDDWIIYAGDQERQHILTYNTELWGE